ncbi:helix-turn-helix domain-containing protein, partial [Pseudomonadota bacterium]
GILLRDRFVARGESIYRQEDPFRAVFAVKSGSFKTLIPGADTREQVVGFYLPGELMGSEGMANKLYPSTAKALEPSHICELRIDRLPEAGRPLVLLQQRMIELLGSEITFNHKLMASIAQQSSEQRLAAFLLSLSQRYGSRGYAGHEFALMMSWADIGSYLGLASETISRMLSKFQKANLLVLTKKQITLLDIKGLSNLAEGI